MVWKVREMPRPAIGVAACQPVIGLPRKMHLAAVGRQRAGDQVEQRGLARAVGPDDRLDRARAARRS